MADFIFNAGVVGILTPMVIGLVQVIKQFIPLKKLAPVVSLVLGILLYWVAQQDALMSEIIIGGIIVGLTASGLYSGGKELMK